MFMLRQRLQQEQPQRVPILHQRASQWFEEHDLLLEAFDHALAGGDPIRAASLAERMAERYQNEGFGGDITIDSIGSGAGFERFCVNAETDISNASRPIKDSEIEAAQENGIEPVEFVVAIDALAVDELAHFPGALADTGEKRRLATGLHGPDRLADQSK